MFPVLRRAPLLPVLAASFLVAGTAAADYVIYTKDGARIVAREKPTVQGNRLLFRTPLGAPQSIAAAEVDDERTEKANKEGYGGAYLLSDAPERKVIQSPSEKKPSLSEYIKRNKKIMKSLGEGAQGTPAESEAPQASGQGTAPRADVAGFMSRKAAEGAGTPLDLQATGTFMQAFEGVGLRGVRLNSIPRGVRVQVVTDTEQQVFGAIAAAARGLKESRALGRPIEKLEIYFVTSGGENAGRFDMSPDDADEILNGKTTPAKYFVAAVIF
jgi:hypothetical protein